MNDVKFPRMRAALEQVQPEMQALSDDDLLAVNLDPIAAACIVRAALPRILPLRPRIERALPELPLSYLDNLELYALAASQAQTLYLGTDAPSAQFDALVDEALAMRELLHSDVSALIRRKLLKTKPLERQRGAPSHAEAASNVLTLANLLRANWPAISAKTGVSLAELDRAEIIGDQLLGELGLREHKAEAVARTALERQKAYTLLVRAYDEVRDGVCYLRRHEGDGDKIAPSLYAGRRARRNKVEVSPAMEQPSAITEPTLQAAPSPETAVELHEEKPRIGLPGADPFLH